MPDDCNSSAELEFKFGYTLNCVAKFKCLVGHGVTG